MDEILKYRKRVILNFVLLLVLSVISVLLVLGASSGFKGNGAALLLLGMFLIEIPVIVSLGINGMRAINHFIVTDQRRKAAEVTEEEAYEKEVEEKAREADELSFNLVRLEGDMDKFSNIEEFGEQLLVGISKQLEIVIGMVYVYEDAIQKFKSVSTYAYYSDKIPPEFAEGDGLTGQVVKDKKVMFIDELPENYINVVSGLGNQKPNYLAIIPVIDKDQVIGIIELATFKSIERGLGNRVQDLSSFFIKKAKQFL